jgi:hypothetical protein
VNPIIDRQRLRVLPNRIPLTALDLSFPLLAGHVGYAAWAAWGWVFSQLMGERYPRLEWSLRVL